MTRTLLGIAFALAATVSFADDRVALVIGNSAYTEVASLQNPKNDATDLAAELSKVGFTVEKVLDADRRAMEMAVDRFVKRISSESAALFHYSGHGMQVNNQNYLIPVDFRMTDEASVKFDAVSASKVHERMLGAGAACANSYAPSAQQPSLRSRRRHGHRRQVRQTDGSRLSRSRKP